MGLHEGQMEAMRKQAVEFEELRQLAKRYEAMPPIVDDDYEEARHHYESALRRFISAVKANRGELYLTTA